MNRLRILALAIAALLSACAGTAHDPVQSATKSPTTTATSAAPVETTAPGAPDFAAQVEIWQAEHDVVGAVVLVVDSAGTEESVAVGFADRQDAIRIQDEDLFRLGSITKIYTAALVLTLVEDGILSLGGSASEYLPNLPDEITVGQLLSHTAGLRDVDVAAGIFEAIEAGGLPEGSGDPVSDALDRGLAYDPGTRQSYSSIGYLAIERIIEGAVGASWEEALSDLLTDRYPSTQLEDASTPLPTPYERLGTASPAISLAGLPTSEFARGAGAAGGLVATASDVAQFVRALFGGEIVDEQSLTEMMDVTSPRTAYGLGLAYYDIGTSPVYGHNGRTIGFASSVRHDPASNITVVVLSNDGAAPTDELADLITAAVNDR